MANSRTLALLALVVLAGCAGMEPAGRNANDAPAPAAAPVASPAPRAAPTPAPMPPPPAQPAPAAVPNVTASAQPAAPRRASGEDVIVPGMRERQVPAPDGDPRTAIERMADIHAWDECVTRAQGRGDPMEAQLESPEEMCTRSLGMASRSAVPDSRRP
jgi:hypothetical protein